MIARSKPNVHEMHQVWVTDRSDRDIPVSPMMDQKDTLYELVQSINLAVASGKEKDWRDARIQTTPTVLQ